MIRFGPFQLDLKNHELRRGERVIALRPKPFQLLSYMAGRPGELLTKDDLLDVGWGKTAVSEGVLKVCIREIREALGDDRASPRYVQTAHRLGYRFKGNTTPEGADKSKQSGPIATAAAGGTHPSKTAFIGRDDQQAKLRDLLAQTIRGQGQIALIGGEPGVGKTRLANEVARNGEALGARVLTGSCYEQRDTLPYLPFVEVLEALADRAADAEDLRATFGEQAAELARLVPRALRPLGRVQVPIVPPEQARHALFAALRELFVRLGDRQPFVLVIDDLQWADESSLALFQYLARRVSQMRVLIVATYRDAELGESPIFAQALEELLRARTVHLLVLHGLSSELTTRMLRSLAGQEPPASLVQLIFSETEGNPFFVEEVFKDLAEERGLFDSAGNFRAELASGQLTVPRNLRLVLRRRLSRLSDSTQAVLTAAAVLGRTFSYDLLEAIRAHDSNLILQIDEAQRAGLIHSAEEPSGARLEFAHELIRQTLLAEISAPHRQRLHLAAADAFERLRPDGSASPAFHLLMAGGTADPERVLRHVIAAADEAIERCAWSEALGLLDSALEVDARTPLANRARHELVIRHAMGVPLRVSRGFLSPELTQCLARVLELCAGVDDPQLVFAALTGVWNVSVDRGDMESAQNVSQRLMNLAAEARAPVRNMIAEYTCGSTAFFRGELKAADRHFENAAALYSPQDHSTFCRSFVSDPGVISAAHRAAILWRLGFADRALELCDRAVALAREISAPVSLEHALFHAAEIRLLRGDHRGAALFATQSIDLGSEKGEQYWLALSMTTRGMARIGLGQNDEGFDEVSRGVKAFRATGSGLDLPYATRIFAEAAVLAGRPDDALEAMTRALDAVESSGVRLEEPELHRLRGELILLSEPRETSQAEGCFGRSLEASRKQSARGWELRASMSLARLLARTDRSGEARTILAGICERFTEGFDTSDLEESKRLLAKLNC